VYKDPTGHLDYIGQPDWDDRVEYMKSKVRCRMEHVFAVVKGKFGYRKAVYRGLKKNLARLYMLFCQPAEVDMDACMRPGNMQP
jgi:IS5 family transposase